MAIWDQLTDARSRARHPNAVRGATATTNGMCGCRRAKVRRSGLPAVNGWVGEPHGDTVAVSHGAFTRILRGLFAGLDWRAMSRVWTSRRAGLSRVGGPGRRKLDP